MNILSERSLNKMIGVNPKLVALVKRAIQLSSIDFGVTEGLRTVERQRMLFNAGKSQTMKSKHIDGLAIDLVAYVDGKVSWDIKHYATINKAFGLASKELSIPYVWGGSWKTLVDGVHFQLDL